MTSTSARANLSQIRHLQRVALPYSYSWNVRN
jgi:hypothetical protein